MKRKLFPLTFFFVLLFTALTAYGQTCGIHCGTERWRVKTLTDTTVGNINSTEVTKTINQLRVIPHPANLPANTRKNNSIETKTIKVIGVVMTFKKESNDNDFHVVIANPNNHAQTMIVEFPDPGCDHVCSSGFLQRMQQARADFIAKFGQPTISFQDQANPIRVEIVGIGFFDRDHGQRGRAQPSIAEIHPVLGFRALQ